MSRRNLVAVTIVAILAVAAVPFAFAQGFGGLGRMHGAMHGGPGAGPMGGPGGPGGMEFFGHLAKMKQLLNLTDDQVTQLQAIHTDLRTQNTPYREQLQGGFHDVAKLLLADPANVAGAQALMTQQEAAEHALKANTLTAVSKALTVLTADQRAKILQFMAERQARHQKFEQHQ